ncbi:glycoside hydrolase superfamily [Xylariaceae sp. FL1651]|nr:glycoside hydrolase superfamily [Xylariaceae sp. FL1651]
MRKGRAWALAHSLVIGTVSAVESSADCALATTTIYVPTTIYAFAPNATNSQGQDGCSVSSSSITVGISTSTSTATTDTIGIPTSTPPLSTITTSSNVSISSTSRTNVSITTTSSVRTSTGLPTPTSITGLPPPPPPSTPFRGFRNAVYFTSWGISTAKYVPQKLPVDDLSHILYAFADIAPNGTVLSSDPVADLDQLYPDDDARDRGRNAYGAVKQLYIHKKYNRNVKVLLSIGGGDYSPKFAAATSTEMGRQTFAKSAVQLVTDWGFDGIDVDWEYPTNEAERDNFVKLLAACRQAFDRYSLQNHLRYRFLVTVASPASQANYQFMDLAQMNRYVDIWHLMAYDYSGSWDTKSGHQANLFANKANMASTPFNTDDAVRHYEAQGISAQKIVLGLPLYGRSFEGTSGLGQNYTSVGPGGPQPGVWYYRDLPKAGAREQFDDAAQATYSYDRASRELISYDDVRSAGVKARYVRDRRLGGAFFWEASGDRSGPRSLIKTVSDAFDWLDSTPNNLYYPTSRYTNIKYGMPGA